ncbi:hypothetical protein VTK26DRAFT_5262 [Humicola hyalothermophila]
MASWGLLDGDEENELHKSRLLNVEEKPFKRITKRLNTLHNLTVTRARQQPTPPPESNGVALGTDQQQQQQPDGASPAPGAGAGTAPPDLAQLKEDITLDFAAFDSSIARLQFLLTANERERERYAAERRRIEAASQSVRDRTAQLRAQLEQARATLARRRRFDELADAITGNPALRPRAEQAANLRKLADEIAELEAESAAYGVTWHERREQFARIMDESMRLRRLIRDEKEEVERREGMDESQQEVIGGGGGGGSGGGGTGGGGGGGGQMAASRPGSAGVGSGNATPRPDSGMLGLSSTGRRGPGDESGDAVGTPRPVSTTGGRTPARESPAPSQDLNSNSQSFLKLHPDAGGSFSQAGSLIGSREASAEREAKPEQDELEEGEDVEMGETRDDDRSEPDSPLTPPPADDPPQILVDGQPDTMDTT